MVPEGFLRLQWEATAELMELKEASTLWDQAVLRQWLLEVLVA